MSSHGSHRSVIFVMFFLLFWFHWYSKRYQAMSNRWEYKLERFLFQNDHHFRKDKACKLDPLPATIMRSCYSALVPVFKTVINLSLSTGSIPEDLKIASLRPLPNKLNADCEQFSNFRPVFNLKFVSKLVEKSVFAQLNNYLTVNGLHERF